MVNVDDVFKGFITDIKEVLAGNIQPSETYDYWNEYEWYKDIANRPIGEDVADLIGLDADATVRDALEWFATQDDHEDEEEEEEEEEDED